MGLVSKDLVCQPRDHGGLGLRHLRDHNTFFMMKTSFNITTNTNVLLVRVLKSKYRVQNCLPESLSSGHGYFLWCSLVKVWPLIRENLLWSVRNEEDINYWKDLWIPKIGLLIEQIPYVSNFDMDCSLRDMVTGDGSWNLNFFPLWCIKEIIARIVGIPPLHPYAGSDRVMWGSSLTGYFSLKSAYGKLQEEDWFERIYLAAFLESFKDLNGLDSSFGLF